ncbi:hypothetical protein PM082_021715 [Marasmius tenuissimus]|nr:hypothetical protein PM082_021715 [Marasmius tenuissimus]
MELGSAARSKSDSRSCSIIMMTSYRRDRVFLFLSRLSGQRNSLERSSQSTTLNNPSIVGGVNKAEFQPWMELKAKGRSRILKR